MARRVVLEWTEEIARVWWKWGHDAPTSAPFPGVRRAWFAFLREWVMDTLESVFRVVRGRGESEVSPLAQYLRIVVPTLPPTQHAKKTHALHGAASILAPPARTRGAGHPVAMTT